MGHNDCTCKVFLRISPEYLTSSIELTGKNKETADHCENHFIFDQPHLFKIVTGMMLNSSHSFHLIAVYIMWVPCGARVGIKWQGAAKQKWLGLPHLQTNCILCGVPWVLSRWLNPQLGIVTGFFSIFSGEIRIILLSEKCILTILNDILHMHCCWCYSLTVDFIIQKFISRQGTFSIQSRKSQLCVSWLSVCSGDGFLRLKKTLLYLKDLRLYWIFKTSYVFHYSIIIQELTIQLKMLI